MESIDAILILSALAQETRLEVFRLLVKSEPDGLPAGEIARKIAVPHNTMSSHLGVLSRAGLVSAERRSRSIVYRVDLERIRDVVGFLLQDCCGATDAGNHAAACKMVTMQGGVFGAVSQSYLFIEALA